jgi:hypothetical protein
VSDTGLEIDNAKINKILLVPQDIHSLLRKMIWQIISYGGIMCAQEIKRKKIGHLMQIMTRAAGGEVL